MADSKIQEAARLKYPQVIGKRVQAGDLNEIQRQAFIAGAEWQKVQLLKDAVERTVKIDSGGYPYIDITAELYDYEHDVPLAKEGELVKIIIVKKDKE